MGYIWFATANGVSRFDGTTFTNYGLDDGLVESTIYEIYPDYRGRLWFISASGRLAYFENGVITPYPFNYRLNDYIPISRGPVKQSFYVDSLDNVHLSLKGSDRLIISTEGIVIRVSSLSKKHNIVVEKVQNGPYLVINNSSNLTDQGFLFHVNNQHFSIRNTNRRTPFHFFVVEENPSTIVMGSGGRLYRIVNGKVVFEKDFGFDIIWMSIDPNKDLWIAPIEGGVHKIEQGNFSHKDNLFMLDNQQISSLTKDNEGGFWFSSLTNGAFYCPNIDILTYNEASGLTSNNLNTVFVNREGIYTGDNNGIVNRITNNTIQEYNLNVDGVIQPIRSIGIDSTSTTVWVGTRRHLYSITNGIIQNFFYISRRVGSAPRQAVRAIEGGYWIASSLGIRKFDGKNFTYNSREDSDFSHMVYSIYQDSTKTLWLATDNGIWTYKEGVFEYLGTNNPLFSHSIKHIAGYTNGQILFATKDVGLIIYNGVNFKRITVHNGLASNYINKIFVTHKGIWLATSNGISQITGNIDGEYSISNINTSHGLPTNEINDIFVKGSYAYVASTKGLSVINTSLLKINIVKPKLLIYSLQANGIEKDLTNNPIKLNYSQNVITIDYIGLAYKNMSKVNYRYQLETKNSSWTQTTATTSTLSGLRPGKYTFLVQAQNSDGLWSDSAKLNFTVKAPYWQTYWFIASLTFLFTLIIFIIYKTRIVSIKRRNELINNLNIYKQKSLRQQMNPHFIFNTLNSIQLYILEKDHISSHKYLTKFAKLMRLILDNSQASSIPLRSELEALKLYLELESIRLSGQFEYSIEVEDERLLDIKVPTLLIQPFVENSIWHGIMLRPNKDGWVKISVKGDKGIIICTIEDNGIGRKAAQKIRAKQDPERKSLGFKITAQRIDLLNLLYKDDFNIQYIDLDETDGSSGTRVVLKIPQVIDEDEKFQTLDR